jgi:hypothetical protein
MTDTADLLNASVSNTFCYVALAIASSAAVRVVSTLLQGLEAQLQGKGFAHHAKQAFVGNRPAIKDQQEGGDYWSPFFLGLIESFAYPILIVYSDWAVIGAWFTLKTIAQYGHWATSRATFNRFLIGNGLVLVGAYFNARFFVQ